MRRTNPYAPPRARVAREEPFTRDDEPAQVVNWFFAGLVDIVIMYVVGVIVSLSGMLLMGVLLPDAIPAADSEMQEWKVFMPAGVIGAGAAFLLYYPILEASAQQASVGKWVVGIRLAITRGQRRLTLPRALARHLANLALMLAALVVSPFLVVVAIAVNASLLAFGPRRQTLHDMLTGVQLVRVRRRVQGAPV